MIIIKHDRHGVLPVHNLTQTQIDAGWYEVGKIADIEAPPDLQEMTKRELEDHARTMSIELDRRMNKTNMLEDFHRQLNDS